MKDKLKRIMDTALEQIDMAEQLDKLNDIKVNFLGKKGELTSLLKSMKDLAPEERPGAGQMVNEARARIDGKIEAKKMRKPFLKKGLQMKKLILHFQGQSLQKDTATQII